ncbi:ubiquitin-specific protease ESD4 [Trifolium repens]|nr:ubiquitin-specific protease ESD4 [Trifolium repens]
MTGTLDGNQYARIKKSLFCQPEEEDDNDLYLNYHPSSIIGYGGFDIDFTIPNWMPMTFRPSPKMSLNQICASTAAYIFMHDAEQQRGDEVLVKTTSGVFGDRAALKSLMSRCPIDSRIINLVVARCNWLISMAKCKSVWYFPTEFAIFIPVNDEGQHWYCVVVDFHDRKVFWLDSLRSNERFHARRHAVLKLVIFLEGIFLHESFKELIPHIRDDLITKFPIIEPEGLPQQRHGSNDCGDWVAKWMIECAFNSHYDSETVVTATRMKLVIFLCQSCNNLLVNELVSKAAHYWDVQKKMRKALIKV